jgi:hypothetical protein
MTKKKLKELKLKLGRVSKLIWALSPATNGRATKPARLLAPLPPPAQAHGPAANKRGRQGGPARALPPPPPLGAQISAVGLIRRPCAHLGRI